MCFEIILQATLFVLTKKKMHKLVIFYTLCFTIFKMTVSKNAINNIQFIENCI